MFRVFRLRLNEISWILTKEEELTAQDIWRKWSRHEKENTNREKKTKTTYAFRYFSLQKTYLSPANSGPLHLLIQSKYNGLSIRQPSIPCGSFAHCWFREHFAGTAAIRRPMCIVWRRANGVDLRGPACSSIPQRTLVSLSCFPSKTMLRGGRPLPKRERHSELRGLIVAENWMVSSAVTSLLVLNQRRDIPLLMLCIVSSIASSLRPLRSPQAFHSLRMQKDIPKCGPDCATLKWRLALHFELKNSASFVKGHTVMGLIPLGVEEQKLATKMAEMMNFRSESYKWSSSHSTMLQG